MSGALSIRALAGALLLTTLAAPAAQAQVGYDESSLARAREFLGAARKNLR